VTIDMSRGASAATLARSVRVHRALSTARRAPSNAPARERGWIKRRHTATARHHHRVAVVASASASRDGTDGTIHVPTLLRLCRAIASRGNEIIRDVTAGGELGVRDKGGAATTDGTYVQDAQTEADRRVEAMMVKALKTFAPELRLVAEESFENASSIEGADVGELGVDFDFSISERLEAEDEGFAPELRRPIALDRVAVYCDPLDGTNEYAAGEREAITVLLGIAVDGTPRAGVVGQPFHNYGKKDRRLGRVVWGGTGIGVHGLDIAADAVAPPLPPNGAHVVAVNRNIRENRQAPVLEALGSRVDIVISATGFHYLMLLERRAHSALLLRKASKKWDTCAGEALLRARGGVVTDTVGRRYDYSYNLDALPNLSGMAASLDVGMHCEMTAIIRDVIEPLGRYPYDVDDPSIKRGVLDGVAVPAGGWRCLSVDVGGCLLEPSERVADVYARTALEVGCASVTPETASRDFKEAFAAFRGADAADASRYYGDGKSFWRRVIAHVLTRGGADTIDDDTIDLAVDKLYAHYERPSAWHVAHGAVDAARRLRRSGVRVVVASNWDLRLPNLLHTLGLRDEFDAIVVSADIGREKPSQEFFQAVARAADVPAESIAHVGDGVLEDVLGAQSAGFGVAVHWSPRPHDDVHHSTHDFNQLADALLAANRVHDDRRLYFP
jgi:REG-2-like HAD superfamily hydrolase